MYLGDDYKRAVLEHMSIEQLTDTLMINPTVHLAPSYRDTGLSASYTFQPLSNLVYTRDQQITGCKGIVMCRLRSQQRQLESDLMRFCFAKLGAPRPAGQQRLPGRPAVDGWACARACIPLPAEPACMQGCQWWARSGSRATWKEATSSRPGRQGATARAVLPGGVHPADSVRLQDLALVGVGLRSNFEACQQLMDEDLLGVRRLAVVRDEFEMHQVGSRVAVGRRPAGTARRPPARLLEAGRHWRDRACRACRTGCTWTACSAFWGTTSASC